MKLLEIQKKPDKKIFTFANMRSDGYILESIKLYIDRKKNIVQIEIQESRLGYCSFGLDGELLFCEAWETEEEAQSKSRLSKHYTSISASDAKGIAFAKRICKNIDKKMSDNYLRFILNEFIFYKKILKFEESYYTVYSPPKEETITTNVETPQQENVVEIITDEIPIEKNSIVHKRKWISIIIGSFNIVLLSTMIYFLFSYVNYQIKWENPAHWPQPTMEDLASENSYAPSGYIYRKRDYVKILNTSLFPTRPLLDKKISQVISDYAKKSSGIEKELQRPVPKITYSNTKEFFDKSYILDKEDQVILFRNEFVKPNQLSNFQMAEILGTLYRENLARLLYSYSPNRIIFASDYLDSQSNKDSLIKYLFFLIHEFPDTEISIEVWIILENLFEIQENALYALFDPLNTATCETKNYAKMENPLERMVCKVYFKNKFFETDFPKEKIKLKYYLFRESILDYALKHNKNSYRTNEIKLRKMILLLSNSESEKALEIFYSIHPENNYGKFLFKENYYIYKKILQEHKAELKALKLVSQYKKDLERKQNDIKEIEKKIATVNDQANSLVFKLLSEKYDKSGFLEKIKKKEESLLYSNK